jgi:excisionase family DNA binding protein
MNEPNNPFAPFFDEVRRIVREEIKAGTNRNGYASPLLTPEQLSETLSVPVSWVYEQSRQGNIPTHRIGKYIRFSFAEVVASQRKTGGPS